MQFAIFFPNALIKKVIFLECLCIAYLHPFTYIHTTPHTLLIFHCLCSIIHKTDGGSDSYLHSTMLCRIKINVLLIQKDTCTPMFIAVLFTIAKTWKQPRCPSAVKWIRKLWYIYTMEYSIQFSSVAQS